MRTPSSLLLTILVGSMHATGYFAILDHQASDALVPFRGELLELNVGALRAVAILDRHAMQLAVRIVLKQKSRKAGSVGAVDDGHSGAAADKADSYAGD